jgi:hypothetical protein
MQGDIYHFADNITLIGSWSPEEFIVAFVDADTASYTPKDILINPLIQIVLTSPPEGAKQQWISQYPRLMGTYVTDLWSPRELFLTGLVISLCV